MSDVREAPFLLHMNDALAASALVAAVLAAFFTLWQSEIQDALNREPSDDPDNWDATAMPICRALRGRALPLFVISGATLVVLGPRAWGIAANALRCAGACAYDDVQALFLLTELLIGVLTAVTVQQVCRLSWRLIKKR